MLVRIDIITVILGLLVACFLGFTNAQAGEITKVVIIEEPFFTDEFPARLEMPSREFDSIEQIFTEMRQRNEAVFMFEGPTLKILAVAIATRMPDWSIAACDDYLGVVVPAHEFAGIANDSLTVMISLAGYLKPFPIKQGQFTFVRWPMILPELDSEQGKHGEGLTVGIYPDARSYMADNIHGYH